MLIAKKRSESKRAKGKKSPTKRGKKIVAVVDTNALYTDHAAFILNADVREAIKASKRHDGVVVEWCIPQVVVDERRFQMAKRASQLGKKVEEYHRLLGLTVDGSPARIETEVLRCVESERNELGFKVVELRCNDVDWDAIRHASCFRHPPFEDVGSNEKGFRDALILETTAQIVAQTPNSSIVALLTSDVALTKATKERFAGLSNVRVYATLLDLNGLINTYAEKVEEEVVKRMAERAGKAFYDFDDAERKDTYWHRLGIGPRVNEALDKGLREEKLVKQTTDSFVLSHPVLLDKAGTKWRWRSQVKRVTNCLEQYSPPEPPAGSLWSDVSRAGIGTDPAATPLFTFSGPGQGGVLGLAGTPNLLSELQFPRFELTQLVDIDWTVTISSRQILSNPVVENVAESKRERRRIS